MAVPPYVAGLTAAEVTSNVYLWPDFICRYLSAGLVVLVGIPPEDLKIPSQHLLLKEISFGGSLVASRSMMEEMLAFSSHHQITPQIQVCSE